MTVVSVYFFARLSTRLDLFFLVLLLSETG
jgi:hypothetical protein